MRLWEVTAGEYVLTSLEHEPGGVGKRSARELARSSPG
jgi:hypothetical protein